MISRNCGEPDRWDEFCRPVTARILAGPVATFPSGSDTVATLLKDGAYSITDVPWGSRIELVMGAGYLEDARRGFGGHPGKIVDIPPLPTASPVLVDFTYRWGCSTFTDRSYISGIIHDDDGHPLDGATVQARVMGTGTFVGGSDAVSTTTKAGFYGFEGVPTGVSISVTAIVPGHVPRQQTIIPRSIADCDLSAKLSLRNNVSFR
ncbi:MAG: carboxypeptidase regulatory-like domain-containing protein [Candidatus Sericytochromatia bacterium]|nr:carboxypeptidase regulatory-like domain-containing protein [Candidatus Sericytochromatia bacterium]